MEWCVLEVLMKKNVVDDDCDDDGGSLGRERPRLQERHRVADDRIDKWLYGIVLDRSGVSAAAVAVSEIGGVCKQKPHRPITLKNPKYIRGLIVWTCLDYDFVFRLLM